MFEIDTPTAVEGQFTEGNPATGVQATVVSAEWLNSVQAEIVNVIEGAGIELDKDDPAQLLAALRKLMVGPAYKRQYVTNSAADDPTDFAAATGLGQVACIKGELVHGVPFNDWGGSVMFSIIVNVAEAATVSIPVLFYDDNAYMFVDGVLVGSNTKPISWTATAGDHLVQFIVNDSNSNAETLVIGEWMDSNVTFLSTPA